MKIIFLDIDGVLNCNFWNDSHQREISDGILIEEEKVKLLSEIMNNSGAQIVLHSGWRFWFDQDRKPTKFESEKLIELFEKYNLSIASMTPDFTTEEIRLTRKFSLVKAKEILAWLVEHPDVEQWIVIDDLDLHEEQVASHQVRTDPTNGLTKEDVALAIRMLR